MFLGTVFEGYEVERFAVDSYFIVVADAVAGRSSHVVDSDTTVGNEAVGFATRAEAVVADKLIDADALVFIVVHKR